MLLPIFRFPLRTDAIREAIEEFNASADQGLSDNHVPLLVHIDMIQIRKVCPVLVRIHGSIGAVISASLPT